MIASAKTSGTTPEMVDKVVTRNGSGRQLTLCTAMDLPAMLPPLTSTFRPLLQKNKEDQSPQDDALVGKLDRGMKESEKDKKKQEA